MKNEFLFVIGKIGTNNWKNCLIKLKTDVFFFCPLFVQIAANKKKICQFLCCYYNASWYYIRFIHTTNTITTYLNSFCDGTNWKLSGQFRWDFFFEFSIKTTTYKLQWEMIFSEIYIKYSQYMYFKKTKRTQKLFRWMNHSMNTFSIVQNSESLAFMYCLHTVPNVSSEYSHYFHNWLNI